MTLGGKYKFKPDSNPPPGSYEPNDKMSKPSTVNQAFGKSKANLDGRLGKGSFIDAPNRDNPSAGNYEPHKSIGKSNGNRMTLGGKYKFKANNNPPPGLYNADRSLNYTKPRIQSAAISAPKWFAV